MHEKKDFQIGLNDLILQKQVGKGAFGKVYRAKNINTHIIYAAKVSKIELDSTLNDQFTDIIREVNIISKLNLIN